MKTSTSPLLRRADHTLEALAVRRRLAWPLLALLLLPALATAATRTVNTLADTGLGSLREAIGASVNGDTINFSVAGMITLTSGELVIGRSIAINGPTLASLTVSGNNASRVFTISSEISVNISSLTIRSGGIGNFGTLTVNNSTFSGNSALAYHGGGIYNEGVLNILNTLIANNSAGVPGDPTRDIFRRPWSSVRATILLGKPTGAAAGWAAICWVTLFRH